MKIVKYLLKLFKIRRDRLLWMQYGFAISSFIATFVASYWHVQDRLAVKPTIKIEKKAIGRQAETKKLREGGYYTPKLRAGATQYYRMEDEISLPKIPDLPEDNEGN